MDTNEVIGPGQSITACLLNFFPSALHFSCSIPSPPLSSSSLSSLSRGGKRVAWLEIKHIHHDPRALYAVDKQASNNVMNFSSLPRCSFFDLPFPRWPSTDRGCETMVEAGCGNALYRFLMGSSLMRCPHRQFCHDGIRFHVSRSIRVPSSLRIAW